MSVGKNRLKVLIVICPFGWSVYQDPHLILIGDIMRIKFIYFEIYSEEKIFFYTICKKIKSCRVPTYLQLFYLVTSFKIHYTSRIVSLDDCYCSHSIFTQAYKVRNLRCASLTCTWAVFRSTFSLSLGK